MIYCVGDPHGDYDRLILLLTQSGIIDSDCNWQIGDSSFVCIGDLSDRGTKGIECIKLLMQLERQARTFGGDVISLLGNHDALILAAAYEQAGESSDPNCLAMFLYNGGKLDEAIALSEDREMFEWMKNRPLMYRENNILFQHADTCNYYNHMGDTIENINSHGLFLAQSGKGCWQIFYEMCDCRYWDSYSYPTKEQQEKHIVQYLEKFDCEKVVHGHTRFIGNEPSISFNGKVINVDGSMSIGYRNDPSRGFVIEL